MLRGSHATYAIGMYRKISGAPGRNGVWKVEENSARIFRRLNRRLHGTAERDLNTQVGAFARDRYIPHGGRPDGILRCRPRQQYRDDCQVYPHCLFLSLPRTAAVPAAPGEISALKSAAIQEMHAYPPP